MDERPSATRTAVLSAAVRAASSLGSVVLLARSARAMS